MSDRSAREGSSRHGAHWAVTRRGLLRLGLGSAAAAAAGLPRPRRVGGPDRRGPARGPRRAGRRAEEPGGVQGAAREGERADHALLLAVRRVPRHRPALHRRRVQEALRSERHPGDHRVPRPQRAARRREVGAGRPEPRPGHHRRGAGRVRGRRVHQRQRARLRQGLRPGPGLPARVLAQRHRAPDHQRRGRLRPRGDEHGDRLLQQGAVRPARARGPPDPGRAEEGRRRPRRQGHRAHRLSGRTGPELPHLPLLHVCRRDQGRQAPARGGPRHGSRGRARSWWPPRSSWT